MGVTSRTVLWRFFAFPVDKVDAGGTGVTGFVVVSCVDVVIDTIAPVVVAAVAADRVVVALISRSQPFPFLLILSS